MTDPDLRALVQAADQNARNVVVEAALHQDVQARQLSVLRNTYPAWDIDIEPDAFGCPRWVALLRRRVSVRLTTAGVVQSLWREDAIALASTLAWQAALLHSVRDTDPL